MAHEGAHNDTGPWPPNETWVPPQRTDTENAEYNSSRAPNSTTHSVDSYHSNSDRSPDENRSESVVRNTGALFGQEVPRRSTTLSSNSTDSEHDRDNSNMLATASGIPTPVQPLPRGSVVPQLRVRTNVSHSRGHGVKRRGSEIDDALRTRAGQSLRSGVSHLKNTTRSTFDNPEYKGTDVPRYGAGWAVTESPTHVSEHERDDDLVSRGTTGPDDSDDEGKTKGSKNRDSATPTR